MIETALEEFGDMIIIDGDINKPAGLA